MALVLKKLYQGYFYLMNDLADPRTEELFLMSSPIPTMLITFLWFRFIMKWGPDFMKDRRPYDLKYVMIVYNIVQITINIYVVYYVIKARHVVNWSCFPVDYSNSYWGLKFLSVTHTYFLLKLLDLLDTVFFILRKKSTHLSFLHIYHHFGMALLGWCGTKYVGGGHSYFVGAANAIVHTILYSYYLLTAYDSKYSKLLWLKKFITQAQLTQFIFLLYMYSKILFMQDCGYPKVVSFFFVPQNFFMMILFGDFYVRTYIIEPNRKKKQLQNNKEGTNVVSEVKDA